MRLLFLIPVLLAAAQAPFPGPPWPAPKPRPDPELVAARAEARMYREAAERFCVLHGRPTPEQWAVVRQDLAAIPPGALHWLKRNGRPVVIVAGEVSEWPGYESYRGVSGAGWPTPLVSLKWAYPQGPNGVSIGGKSVVLHEVGHTLGFLMDGAFGRDLTRIRSTSPEWRAAWARQDWRPLGVGYARDPEEAHAESFAVWAMTRKGGFDKRLPAGADLTPVLDYWDRTARECGW